MIGIASLLAMCFPNLQYSHLVVNKYLSLIFRIVTALPNITKHPLSTTIMAGASNIAALHCSATGIGPIYYRWEKYNLSSNDWIDPSYRAISITTKSLNFSVITEEDEAVYRCIVTNDDGSVISDNATIQIYGKRCVV